MEATYEREQQKGLQLVEGLHKQLADRERALHAAADKHAAMLTAQVEGVQALLRARISAAEQATTTAQERLQVCALRWCACSPLVQLSRVEACLCWVCTMTGFVWVQVGKLTPQSPPCIAFRRLRLV